jgi:hypothetical protein
MKVHNATYSCSVELYKQWYTLVDFLTNWDISRGFSIHYLPEGTAKLQWAGRGTVERKHGVIVGKSYISGYVFVIYL